MFHHGGYGALLPPVRGPILTFLYTRGLFVQVLSPTIIRVMISSVLPVHARQSCVAFVQRCSRGAEPLRRYISIVTS
jgi:hypothetical protein